MKTSVAIVDRELAAAQRRAEKAWIDLEEKRSRMLQEVDAIEKELKRMHPVMQRLFA